jgi:hypothetical protein
VHSEGGIPVRLEPYPFIFSAGKVLANSEEKHKLFEFKKAAAKTPATTLPLQSTGPATYRKSKGRGTHFKADNNPACYNKDENPLQLIFF